MTTPGHVRTAYLVKRLELAVRARLDAAVRPHGLTTAQYTALTALRGGPGMSSAQLARRSFVSPQTMQELVVNLERRGLVTRSPSPDNRRVLGISLTDAGEAELRRLDEDVDEIERQMLADLDDEQVAALREALRRCTQRLTGR
ncbi:DNA-binding MarR family transcriptional regulator [Prauserella shujinwangii]|uniref:DNA-binding MarR family transcriptional regulator n=1 Tax=Prauserella shujinwangii TaxID=1453103 RepID=A0A2T0LUX7_9PSEU|nr:MarR family transcriptional regulator [Prauserella shujinwangii]PRX47650.1 DNA-binding MarR family transcriptional regulator [Prauserella shujinwangii]